MEALEDLEAAGCTQSPLLEPGPVICDRGEFQNPTRDDGGGLCSGDSGGPSFYIRITCGPCS